MVAKKKKKILNCLVLIRLCKEAEIPVINFTLYKQEDGTIKSTRDQVIKGIHL